MNAAAPLAALLAALAAVPAGAVGLEQAFASAAEAVAGAPTADLPDFGPVPDPDAGRANPVTTYGVIINGDGEEHHTRNADRFYGHMRSYYGIAAADIAVLSTHRGTLSDRRGVDYAARTLKAKADANDRVVIYTTGHGTRRGDATYLVLADDALIKDGDFAAAFLDNAAARVTYVADQCYSGGFAEAMTAGNRAVLAISASDAYNTTYCQSFIVPYVQAFAEPANDTDRDGRVDEREAYATASRRHRSERGAAQGNAQLRESGPDRPGRLPPMS